MIVRLSRARKIAGRAKARVSAHHILIAGVTVTVQKLDGAVRRVTSMGSRLCLPCRAPSCTNHLKVVSGEVWGLCAWVWFPRDPVSPDVTQELGVGLTRNVVQAEVTEKREVICRRT